MEVKLVCFNRDMHNLCSLKPRWIVLKLKKFLNGESTIGLSYKATWGTRIGLIWHIEKAYYAFIFTYYAMLQCSQYLLASYPQQELWSDYYAIYIQVCMDNTPHAADNFRKTALLECIYERYHYYYGLSINDCCIYNFPQMYKYCY